MDEQTKTTAAKQWTVGELLNWTASHLSQKNVESPRVDAEVLLADVLKCDRIDLYGLRFAETATQETRDAYRERIRKRLQGCPVAYLVGRKEFFQLHLKVTQDVLIPRPDSETLVMECLTLAKNYETPRILDIGTGSGNLAIALAVNVPAARVTAVDLSEAALAVAKENAERHGVADRIRFVNGDLFDHITDAEPFDFIVSNPPYIPHDDIASLPIGVRDYEPHLALDGGPDGFAVFRRLVDEARAFLAPGGTLFIEIGSPQEATARQYIEEYAEYELAPTIRDAGRHPRVLMARRR